MAGSRSLAVELQFQGCTGGFEWGGEWEWECRSVALKSEGLIGDDAGVVVALGIITHGFED